MTQEPCQVPAAWSRNCRLPGLAAYRVVYGQPRQEEFFALLGRVAYSITRLQELTIDLSPWSMEFDTAYGTFGSSAGTDETDAGNDIVAG